MRSIQDVGQEILTGNPAKLYVMLGTEYGIKEKYIEILTNHYGEKAEAESLNDVLKFMRTKHLIPPKPKLYVVRYDDEFLSTINDRTQSEINNTKIIGTVVCLYEQPKHSTKVDKYLPDYTISIDGVTDTFVKTYLRQDFPHIPDRFVNIAVSSSDNYNQARNMCRCMTAVPAESLHSLSDAELSNLLGCSDTSTESQFRKGVAAKNFKYLMAVIDNFDGDVDSMMYNILSTMVELDKCMDKPQASSDIREYVKLWTREDIYYMFMNTYAELKKLRSISIADPKNNLIYLVGLLQFAKIPSPEVMS